MASTDSARKGGALALRILVTAIAIGAWFGTQALIGSRSLPSSGIGDGLLTLTAPLNHYLVQHPGAANALLIVSSGFVDLMALFLFGEWIVGRSVRPLLGLAILLGLRQLMEALCALPAPQNIIWHYPGFPSLLVTYNVANDFFFSAHTSIAVLAATEVARLRRRWLTMLAGIVVVFEAVAVLALRAHYTMDVFTAIVAALYVAHLSDRLSPALDRRFARYLSPAPSPPAGGTQPTCPSPVSAN
ncbi:MAG TPA: phosphatase PAP2-related protein [Terriglobia bacterium]|nr:phosphatase PAP2-related protein [Terriglobia bacterium]